MDITKLINRVFISIEKETKQELSESQVSFLRNLYKGIDFSSFAGKKISDLITAIVNLSIKELQRLPSMDNNTNIDVKEIQISLLGEESESSLIEKKRLKSSDTINSILHKPIIAQSIFNPEALKRTAHLLLDRKYQDTSANNITEFKWNVSDISKVIDKNTTSVSTISIKDLISVKMLPFRFPHTTNAFNGINRLSVEVIEFNTQAYVHSALNKRFHFLFNLLTTGDVARNFPYNTDDIGNHVSEYKFHDPIVDFNSITIKFGNPLELLSLDPDILYATITSVGAQALLTFTVNHYCEVGDRFVVYGFNTTNPTADANKITAMNNSSGYAASAVTANTATIDVDLSTLVGAISGNPFKIYLEGKRFFIPLELTYIIKN